MTEAQVRKRLTVIQDAANSGDNESARSLEYALFVDALLAIRDGKAYDSTELAENVLRSRFVCFSRGRFI